MMTEDQENLLSNETYESHSDSQEPAPRYRLYKRRWFIVLAVAVLNFSNGMIWITFSPVANEVEKFYNVTTDQVNWLSLVFPIATLPFGVLATWWIDTIGLRTGLLLACWLNLSGSLLRGASTISVLHAHVRYPVLMLGQTLASLAQPFALFSTTKVAAGWFPENQRATANTIGSIANPVGILVANLVSPAILTSSDKMSFLLWLYCAPAILVALMTTFGVCSSLPPTPPTLSAKEHSQSFIHGFMHLVHSKSYWVLSACYGAGLALFTAQSTLMEQILCPAGYSDSFAGLCGALLIGIGVIGAAVAGGYVDKTKNFEETAKVAYLCSVVFGILFLVLSRYPNMEIWLAISISLQGFFGLMLNPVCLELGVECTYPTAEATSSGFQLMFGQLQSIILILVMQASATPYPMSLVPNQTCQTKQGDEIPLNFIYSNVIFMAIAAIASISFVLLFKCEYKRMNAEQNIAAQRIIDTVNSRHLDGQ